MTREEAIAFFKDMNECTYGNLEAVEMAIQALENIGHLTDRPCEVCEYHGEYGCCKWDCVFKGV